MGEYWVAYPVAGVLAHERIHAMGDLSEAAALLEELRLDRRFRDEGKLPKTFDLDGLQQQYLEALAEERRPGAAATVELSVPRRRLGQCPNHR
jgi:hypothetical protein